MLCMVNYIGSKFSFIIAWNIYQKLCNVHETLNNLSDYAGIFELFKHQTNYVASSRWSLFGQLMLFLTSLRCFKSGNYRICLLMNYTLLYFSLEYIFQLSNFWTWSTCNTLSNNKFLVSLFYVFLLLLFLPLFNMVNLLSLLFN